VPLPELNAVVTQRIEVAPDLVVMRVAPVGWELPPFKPGQFAVLGLPGSAPRHASGDAEDPAADPDRLIRRSYSIASSSLSREYLEFFVTLVHSGALTPRLFALRPGDRLWLGPKITGSFTLDQVPDDKNLALVATGTGLAPYMSMLRTELPTWRERRALVLLGARHSWDLGYREELEMLDKVAPAFSFVPTVSRPQEEFHPWRGASGYVQNLWTGGIAKERWGFAPSPDDTHVLLCGNPKMIEDMAEILVGEGFKEHKKRDPGQIHMEKYW
jgi:ferredoxin--NADP+ reductase